MKRWSGQDDDDNDDDDDDDDDIITLKQKLKSQTRNPVGPNGFGWLTSAAHRLQVFMSSGGRGRCSVLNGSCRLLLGDGGSDPQQTLHTDRREWINSPPSFLFSQTLWYLVEVDTH